MFVLAHDPAAGQLLGLPAADGGRPADQGDVAVAVARVERQHRPLAAGGAIDGGVQIEHSLMICGERRRGDRDQAILAGEQRAQAVAGEREFGPSERAGGRLGRGGDQVVSAVGGQRGAAAVAQALGVELTAEHGPPRAASRAVLDQPGGVGDPLPQHSQHPAKVELPAARE